MGGDFAFVAIPVFWVKRLIGARLGYKGFGVLGFRVWDRSSRTFLVPLIGDIRSLIVGT